MCKRLVINAGIERVVIRKTKGEFAEVYVDEWIQNDESMAGSFGY